MKVSIDLDYDEVKFIKAHLWWCQPLRYGCFNMFAKWKAARQHKHGYFQPAFEIHLFGNWYFNLLRYLNRRTRWNKNLNI